MASPEVFDNPNRRQYTASASQTVFAYPFLIFEEEDIAVYYQAVGTDDAVLLTLNVDYTVTGVGNEGGGNVILTTPATLGDIITVNSEVAFTQLVDFSVGGEFTADTINFVNDKLTRLIQQVKSLIENQGLTYEASAVIDQNQTTRKDTRLPVLPANTGAGIPIWTKNSDGALVAGVCAEEEGCSTLRSELISDTNGSDGAHIVGYYDPQAMTGTTVGDALDNIINTVVADIFQTGDVKLTFRAASDPGWVLMDDGTIGDAISGATSRANADTEDLFTLLWNNIIDQWAPVSGGRGASAAADFAASKTIMLPRVLGRAMAVSGLATLSQEFIADFTTDQLTVADANIYYTGTPVQLTTTGTLPTGLLTATTYYVIPVSGSIIKLAATEADAVAGTEVTFTTNGSGVHSANVQFTSRALGETVGEEAHVLLKNEMTEHVHTYDKGNVVTFKQPTVASGSVNEGVVGANTGNAAADGLISNAHNNIPPTSFFNVMVKL